MNSREALWVKCHSGYTYAERPESFAYRNEDCKVSEIVMEWLEPGEKHFQVLTGDSKLFELCYNYQQDEWSLGKGG